MPFTIVDCPSKRGLRDATWGVDLLSHLAVDRTIRTEDKEDNAYHEGYHDTSKEYHDVGVAVLCQLLPLYPSSPLEEQPHEEDAESPYRLF